MSKMSIFARMLLINTKMLATGIIMLIIGVNVNDSNDACYDVLFKHYDGSDR